MTKKKLHVLLVNPFFIHSEDLNSYDLRKILNRTQFVEPPLGLGSISSYIRANLPEVEIEVLDCNAMAVEEILKDQKIDMEYLYRKVGEEIASFNPDIVGISALFEFIGHTAKRFADLCKNILPEVMVVIGGAYASFSYERAFNNRNIDFAIVGEGEEAFRQFLEYALGRRRLENVGSLAYVDRETGRLHVNSRVEPMGDLSVLPRVDRSKFKMELYATLSKQAARKFYPDRDTRVASLFASRGCVNQCGFCSTKRLWGASIRYRSINELFDEIEYLIDNHSINTFFFADDNIAVDRAFFTTFLKKLIKLREKHDIRWTNGGFQLTRLDSEIIKMCIDSGIAFFPLAFESGSSRSLKLMKKPLTLDKAKGFVEMFRKYAPDAYLFGAWITGFPFETKEDIRLTHEFAKEVDLDWSSFYCYQPFPGTPIYEECVRLGYVNPKVDSVTIPDIHISNAISTDAFSADYLISANYHANLEMNFIGNRNLRGRGNRQYAYQDFLDITLTYPDHVFGYYGLSEFFKLEGDKVKADKYIKMAVEASERNPFFDKYIKDFHLSLSRG